MSEEFPKEVLFIKDYLQEVFILSDEIINLVEEIDNIVSEKRLGMEDVFNFPDNDNFFYIEPRIFTKITSAIVHGANLKKILFATPKTKKEAQQKYDYRVLREYQLKKHFNSDDLSEVKKTMTRNSLEHYDERLDNISLKFWQGKISGKYDVVVNNIVLSSEGALIGNPFYLKCYIIDSQIYKNHETECDLKKLYSEVKLLKSQAKIALVGIGANPYSGTIIPIPPRN